jgi:cyclic-di-AMP phosphodiesterase PgpH
MSEQVDSPKIRWPSRRTVFIVLLVLGTALLAYISLLGPLYASLTASQLQQGEVASQDILAPRTATYNSQVLTETQRDLASRSIAPVYTQPDPGVARRQLERLRATLAFINTTRADSFASLDRKITDLAALEHIHLSHDTAESILTMSNASWQRVEQETTLVLETVMRRTIREDRLEDERRIIPAWVSLALPEDLAAVVADIVSGFIAPNSFYSESLTAAARQEAREAVAPISRTFLVNETIVQRGQVITSADLEALEFFGLRQPEARWQDLAGAAALVVLMVVFVILYMHRRPALVHDMRGMVLIAVLFLLFLLIGRLVVPGHVVVPYIFPLTAFSLVLVTLFGIEVALIFTLPLVILFAYNLPNGLDLTVYYLLGAFVGIFTLGPARRLAAFFWAGAAIGVASAIVIIAFRLPQPDTDWIGILTLIGIAHLNGIASAGLTVLLQVFLAQFLGLTTALQLMEISRPDNPLLQFILRNSPGTYQHSLQVANLAEQAAEHIGADPLLTRVGALYHDAGKALNPFYFIENQVPGSINPHDELDPLSSSAAIIRHVTDGLELARKHRLPGRIRDFIAEHHGTMVTRYQYVRAVEAANGEEEQVDENLFRYPGPRPQSRETAILMLADGTEARMRAERPRDEAEIRALVESVVAGCQDADQLDDTDLTFNELDKIVETFITTLRGLYHPRIEYPKLDQVVAAKKGADSQKSEDTHPLSSDVQVPSRVNPMERP